MNKYFLFLLCVIIYSCQSTDLKDPTAPKKDSSIIVSPLPSVDSGIALSEDEIFISTLLKEDIQYLEQTIAELEGMNEDEENMWLKSDKIFYSYWLNGSREELNANYEDAITLYNKALNTTRHEMSSYNVKSSIGRAKIKKGDFKGAITTLNAFIKEAKQELTETDPEWALSEEGVIELKTQIENCKKLINIANRKLLIAP